MRLTEQQVRELYANWVITECSCPMDEIEYLFDNLPKDHKDQIALDMQDKANDIYLP